MTQLPPELTQYLTDTIASIEGWLLETEPTQILDRDEKSYHTGYKDALADVLRGVWLTRYDEPVKRESTPVRTCDCGARLLTCDGDKCPTCAGLLF